MPIKYHVLRRFEITISGGADGLKEDPKAVREYEKTFREITRALNNRHKTFKVEMEVTHGKPGN